MTARRRALAALSGALVAVCAPVAVAVAQQPVIPIPSPLEGPLPRFTGEAATPNPLKGPFPAPNAALAADGRSGSGLSPAGGGLSPYAGPLGRGTTRTHALMFGTCGGVGFDPEDRIVVVCNGPLGPSLRLVDPVSLATLATLPLPLRPSADRTDLAGGTHFVVRADGTLLVPTHAGTLISVDTAGGGLVQTGAIDLGGVLAEGERPFAVGAGYDGRDWVAGTAGTVVTVPRDGGGVKGIALSEEIAEDVATAPSGTYVVTSEALYRLVARRDGTPRVVWRLPINGGVADTSAGRLHGGSGTPPVVLPDGKVAVADARNPPRIVVARVSGRESRRLACLVDVFEDREGSVEAHLTVAGRSLVVSNAYGYQGLLTTEGGRTTTGGMTRVVVGRRGCRTAWRSDVISPSAQPVVSRATGLLYTLEKPAGFPDRWNLAALDWRTGALRFSALAGEGLGFNSDGGPVVLGPDGAAYAGTFGGLVRFADLAG